MLPFVRVIFVAALLAGPAWSQEAKPGYTPAEADAVAQMHALQSQVGEGKRAFIEEQLSLTPEEATKFWPIYDAHQTALASFNQRRLDNILAYARHWNAGSLDDASAKKLGKEAFDLEKDEAVQMERTFSKLTKAIPAVKAVRYLQVESKLRAVVRFEQAAQVPLVP